MNALQLLKADHRVVDAYFQEIEAGDDEAQQFDIFEKVRQELEIHAHVEETIFYPVLLAEGDEELVELVNEGLEEHEKMKENLAAISSAGPGGEDLGIKLQVLIEDTRHHVEEEETEMFSLVSEQFDETALSELGKEMETEKTTATAQTAAAAN